MNQKIAEVGLGSSSEIKSPYPQEPITAPKIDMSTPKDSNSIETYPTCHYGLDIAECLSTCDTRCHCELWDAKHGK